MIQQIIYAVSPRCAERVTYVVLPPFCLEAVGLAFIAAEEPLAALLAALRAFTSLHIKMREKRKKISGTVRIAGGGCQEGQRQDGPVRTTIALLSPWRKRSYIMCRIPHTRSHLGPLMCNKGALIDETNPITNPFWNTDTLSLQGNRVVNINPPTGVEHNFCTRAASTCNLTQSDPPLTPCYCCGHKIRSPRLKPLQEKLRDVH